MNFFHYLITHPIPFSVVTLPAVRGVLLDYFFKLTHFLVHHNGGCTALGKEGNMKNLLIWGLASLLVCASSCKKDEEEKVAPEPTDEVSAALKGGISPLATEADLDVLLNKIGNAKYVLLGEASHGTSEFYAWRAAITRRLIAEKGFTFVAVEGDWPDAYELNRYIRGTAYQNNTASQVLQNFNRWPTWMWANQEIAQLADWFKSYNAGQGATKPASFYGLDVYSLWESLDRVIEYLETADPAAAQSAREAYACFAGYQGDEQAYAQATFNPAQSCAEELARMLERVQAHARSAPTSEEAFNAEQNALVAVNAERYYHAMVRSGAQSWNVRDQHMMTTLNRLMERHGPDAKAIVWAHNTHVGDARYTDMAASGEVNIGQLVREQHEGAGVYLVGFSTYRGTVIAADEWGAKTEEMRVPEARQGSWDAILHNLQPADKIVMLDQLRNEPALKGAKGQRAIGVVYSPGNEAGNYVPTVLTQRYDALLFIDQTNALKPLPVKTNGRTKSAEVELVNK
jgi:erythromycin esterase-like protein